MQPELHGDNLDAFLDNSTVVAVTVRLQPVSELTRRLALETVRLFAKFPSSVAITSGDLESYTVGDILAITDEALMSFVEGHLYALEQPPVECPAMH